MAVDLVAKLVDVRRVVGTVRINVVRPCLNGMVLTPQFVDLVAGSREIKYWAIWRSDRADGRWTLRTG